MLLWSVLGKHLDFASWGPWIARGLKFGSRALDHVFEEASDLLLILLYPFAPLPPHGIPVDLKLVDLLLYQLILKRGLVFDRMERGLCLELGNGLTTRESVPVSCPHKLHL